MLFDMQCVVAYVLGAWLNITYKFRAYILQWTTGPEASTCSCVEPISQIKQVRQSYFYFLVKDEHLNV